jgi:hypothetical protein
MDLDKKPEEIRQRKVDYYEFLENQNYQADQESKPFEINRITDLDLKFPVNRLSEIQEIFSASELMQIANQVDRNLCIFINANRCFALQRVDCEINPITVTTEILGENIWPDCAFVIVRSPEDLDFEDLKHFKSIPNRYIVTPEKIWKIPEISQIHQFIFEYRMEVNLDTLIESEFIDADTLMQWLDEDIRLYEDEINTDKKMKEHYQKFLDILENYPYKQLSYKLNYNELLDLKALLKAADLNSYLTMKIPIFPQRIELTEYSTEELNNLSKNLRAFMGELLGNIEKERLYNYLTSIEKSHRDSEEGYRKNLESLLRDTSDFRQYRVINSDTLSFFHEHFADYYYKRLARDLSSDHYRFITNEIKNIHLRQILDYENQNFLVPVDTAEVDKMIKS